MQKLFYINNGMSLNIDKCSVISYSLKKNTILYNYVLHNTNPTRKYIIKDLGVSFDTKLSFSNYVDSIRNKSNMKLGLLKRMCSDLNGNSALKILYYSLVLSHIVYASLIWHSDGICQNQSLSSIIK